MSHTKIVSIDKLLDLIKFSKKKVSLVHGVFDVLHYGHKRHLDLAKSYGEILIASITTDKYVKKGPNRPIFNENYRAEMLASLEAVDYVVLSNYESAVNIIKLIKPNYYFKGQDYKDLKKDITRNIFLEKKAVESFGGSIIFTDDIQFSSSNIINNYFSKNNLIIEDIKKLNISFKKFRSNCLNAINQISELKVAIIGEVIFDEYLFCKGMEKPSKENITAVQFLKKNIYLGGSVAIAKNLSEFCKKIDVYSAGDFSKEQYRILSDLKIFKNIKLNILDKHFNTITKTRILEESNKKIFEIYYKKGLSNLKNTKKIISTINDKFSSYDVVIVSDFGHGLLNQELYKLILKKSKFISVNAQTNADNRGFNYITKYKKADLVCVDRPEIQLALSDRSLNLINLSNKISKIINFKNLMITLGSDGIFLYDKLKKKNLKLRAFSTSPIDTIGAGDAVFGIASLMASKKLDINVITFLSNIFGALSTKIIGHSNFIQKKEVIKTIMYTLK